jgi:O-antigen polymerase
MTFTTAHAESDRSNSWIGRLLLSRTAIVLICALYIAVFVLAYDKVVVPVWGYEGFRSRASAARAAAGWVLALLPSFWMPIRLTRPSQVVYWVLYSLILIPACLVPIYALEDQSSGPILLAVCLVASFGLTGLIYRFPLLPVPRVQLQSYEFWTLVALLSTISYALLVSSFGFHLNYVSLQDIYVVRAEYQDTLNHASPLVAYAITWQMYVVNPLVMAKGLTSRRWLWALVALAGQYIIYSITGFRSVFFSALFLLYLLWAMREDKPFGTRFASSWGGIFAGAAGLQYLGYAMSPEALIGVRMTALPGLLTGYYYEFFSSHPQAHLGHSILKSLVAYPYAVEPPYIIAYTYFHSAIMESNANLWADAFANFGYAGIVGSTLLVAVVLWLYDSLAFGRDRRVVALAIALPAFALANTGLLTTMLTHGFGLAMLLVYLMPPQESEASEDGYVLVRSSNALSRRVEF